MNSQFKEGADQRVVLLEDEPDTVGCFVQLLYYKCYTLSESDAERFLHLAKLYVFADKSLVHRLKDDIVSTLFCLRSEDVTPPQLPVIKYTFEHLPDQSSFRKIMVDWYAWHIDLSWFEKFSTKEALMNYPEFTAEVISRLAKSLRLDAGSLLLGKPETYYESMTKNSPQ